MDPQVAKRLKTKIIVYPCIGIQRGDRIYGTPYVLKGYLTYRERTEEVEGGHTTNYYTLVYFDGKTIPEEIADQVRGFLNVNGKVEELEWNGERYTIKSNGEEVLPENLSGILSFSNGKQIQFANVKETDMVEVPGQGRIPVTTVKAYQGLRKGTQSVEVIL